LRFPSLIGIKFETGRKVGEQTHSGSQCIVSIPKRDLTALPKVGELFLPAYASSIVGEGGKIYNASTYTHSVEGKEREALVNDCEPQIAYVNLNKPP